VSGVPEALRARFAERCRNDLAALESSPSQTELRALAHGLAGAGGTFGHPEISAAAAAIEDVLLAGRAPTDAETQALRDALEQAVRPGR
jgi:HPt (histidine-containing phosphotransfer) domain-containing protein